MRIPRKFPKNEINLEKFWSEQKMHEKKSTMAVDKKPNGNPGLT